MSVTVLPLANQVIRQFGDFPDVDMRFASKADFEMALVSARIPDGWMAYCVAEKEWFICDKASGSALPTRSNFIPKVIINGDSARVQDPEGGSFQLGYDYTTLTKVTGIIRLRLPQAYGNSMLTIEGTIKRSNADEVIKFSVGGYWSGDTTHNWWSNDPAQWKRLLTDNLDLPVKFGYVTVAGEVYPVIDLGETTTVWSSYMLVVIDKIYINNGFGEGIETGFDISVVTADDSVSNRNTTFVLDKGDKGDTGDAGADGADGVDGLSAYQIAVNDGFVGTEAEWLLSLKGADGADGNPAILPFEMGVACSDEVTNLTSGTAKVTFRTPIAFTLTNIYAGLTTVATGSTVIINIKKNGTSIFTTKLSINASSKTSIGATTPYVLTTDPTTFAIDDEVTIDIDQVGAVTSGKGLKIFFKGTRI